MFKNMKLIHKVVLLAVIIIGINLVLQTNFILKMRETDIETAKFGSLSEAVLQAGRYENEFQRIERLVKGYADDFGQLIERGELTREAAIELLGRSLEANESIVGHGLGFEANTFDGQDAAHSGASNMGADSRGRFLPYISLDGGKRAVEPLTGYDVEGDGDWYLIPKNTLQSVVTDPYIYPVNGEDVLMFTISYPVLNNGRFIGVVTADIALSQIDGFLLRDSEESHYDLQSTMLTESGSVIGSTMDAIKNDGAVAENPVVQTMTQDTEEGVYFDETSWTDGKQLVAYVPIEFLSDTNRWFMMNLVPERQILKDYRQNLYFNLGIIAVALVFIIVLIYFIQRSIKTPINKLMTVISTVENGDLTQSCELGTKDEMGILSENFDHMIDKMKQLINNVQNSSTIVGESAEKMAAVTHQSVVSISNVNSVVSQIADAHSKQSEDIEEIVQKTALLSELINDTTALIEQVAGISENTQKVSNEGLVILNDLNEKTQITMDRSDDISKAVDEVNASVESISGITTIIDDIAGQTNLLALNASIEAARAGEAGRGFAVVAEEIRKLAEQTSAATAEISKVIETVMTKSTQAVTRVTEVSTSQQAQFSSIEKSSEIFRAINESFMSLKEKIIAVDEKSTVIERSKEEILDAVTNISAVSEETTASTEETTSMMNEQKQAIEELSDYSETLNNLTHELKQYVNAFKV